MPITTTLMNRTNSVDSPPNKTKKVTPITIKDIITILAQTEKRLLALKKTFIDGISIKGIDSQNPNENSTMMTMKTMRTHIIEREILNGCVTLNI